MHALRSFDVPASRSFWKRDTMFLQVRDRSLGLVLGKVVLYRYTKYAYTDRSTFEGKDDLEKISGNLGLFKTA